MQTKKELVNNEKYGRDKKKKTTPFIIGILCVICYIVFEILYLYTIHTQSGLSGAISEEIVEQIKSRSNIRNIFELGIYICFLIYSWSIWSYSSEKKYKKYFINVAYVILSVFVLGFVFLGIQFLLTGTVYGNHFMPGVILVWFSILNLLIISGMQAKKDKRSK